MSTGYLFSVTIFVFKFYILITVPPDIWSRNDYIQSMNLYTHIVLSSNKALTLFISGYNGFWVVLIGQVQQTAALLTIWTHTENILIWKHKKGRKSSKNWLILKQSI